MAVSVVIRYDVPGIWKGTLDTRMSRAHWELLDRAERKEIINEGFRKLVIVTPMIDGAPL